MSDAEKQDITVIPKTLEGLRDAIFDEINSLRVGTGNIQKSRAIALLASQAIDSIRVQIQYGRLVSQQQKNKEYAGVYLGSN